MIKASFKIINWVIHCFLWSQVSISRLQWPISATVGINGSTSPRLGLYGIFWVTLSVSVRFGLYIREKKNITISNGFELKNI